MPLREAEGRPKSSDEPKDMWSSMLDGVASGKKLPEKTALVLGGTPSTQNNFLESLSTDPSDPRRLHDASMENLPPVANQFALGYTYRDVLDADHEDILARLSLYLLSDPSTAFMPLVRPLLAPHTIPNIMVVILLDWAQPWSWVRQLKEWIGLLRALLVSLDDDSKEVLEEVLIDWRDRNKGNLVTESYANANNSVEGEVTASLGPGEWDEALGLPLCVVCQNAEKMDILEKEQAWGDEEFDFVLSFLRTILLKHGASLIYTSSSAPGSLQNLIHSTLGIQSILKRQPLKSNFIDRNKITIPSKWDSWGKIRIQRDGFDVEGVSSGWSADLHASGSDGPWENGRSANGQERNPKSGALETYESSVPPPAIKGSRLGQTRNVSGLEVEGLDAQEFLASQLDILQKLQADEESQGGGGQAQNGSTTRTDYSQGLTSQTERGAAKDYRVNDHIGPVQTNVGGIQMDADDVLKKIIDREANRAPNDSEPYASPSENKSQNEALASFFSGLMNRSNSKYSNN